MGSLGIFLAQFHHWEGCFQIILSVFGVCYRNSMKNVAEVWAKMYKSVNILFAVLNCSTKLLHLTTKNDCSTILMYTSTNELSIWKSFSPKKTFLVEKFDFFHLKPYNADVLIPGNDSTQNSTSDWRFQNKKRNFQTKYMASFAKTPLTLNP